MKFTMHRRQRLYYFSGVADKKMRVMISGELWGDVDRKVMEVADDG